MGHRLARGITAGFTPAVIIVVLCLAVAWHATGSPSGTVLWGGLAALFASGVPVMVIARGMRRGTISDFHVKHRSQRLAPLAAATGSALAGVILLSLTGAPGEVVAVSAALLAGVLGFGLVTVWWKVSFHSGVTAAAAALLIGLYGPLLLVSVPVALLVAWARVRLGEHTVPQVLAGLLCGPAVAGLVFFTAL